MTHPIQTAPRQVMDRPWQAGGDEPVLANVQDSGCGQGCADLFDDLAEGAMRQRQISQSLQNIASGYVRNTASLFASNGLDADHWQRETSQTLEEIHNSGTVRARARQFEVPVSPKAPRSQIAGRIRARRFVTAATDVVKTLQCITEDRLDQVKTPMMELQVGEGGVAVGHLCSDAMFSLPTMGALSEDCDERSPVPESPVLPPTTGIMRTRGSATVAADDAEKLQCISEEGLGHVQAPVLDLPAVESDVAAEELKGTNEMPVGCSTMIRSVTEHCDSHLESNEKPARSCSAPALTHFYCLYLDDVEGHTSAVRLSSESSSSSDCDLAVDAAEASIWGDVFVKRIQAWFRRRAERCKAEALAHGEAVAQKQQELSLHNDIEQFANGGLPQAFQERVQTRAYYSFLNGCLDEQSNYFNALKVELELAYTASRSERDLAVLGA